MNSIQLDSLLTQLLSDEHLPPVDRWFSALARQQQWTIGEQKRLWDGLRRALCRGFLLVGSGPESTPWPAFRTALRGRAGEWARLAEGPVPRASLAGAGIPPWWSALWDERVKRSSWTEADQTRFWGAQETPAPAYVRFREGPEGRSAQEKLSRAGVVVSDAGAWRLVLSSGIEGTEEWRRGLVEIQDAASQFSLDGLELRPGQRVWDVCAGRGGKTMLAAAELRGKGAVMATDVSEGRLKALKERLRRSGWQNVRHQWWDGEALPDFGRELSRGFDRVIVDAPCTASGTWRRDPEGRYRMNAQTLSDLGRHQSRLLRLGWSALKPGGRLAYVTCSWLPAENETIVETFVQESGARPVSEKLLGLPSSDANTVYSAILEKPREGA